MQTRIHMQARQASAPQKVKGHLTMTDISPALKPQALFPLAAPEVPIGRHRYSIVAVGRQIAVTRPSHGVHSEAAFNPAYPSAWWSPSIGKCGTRGSERHWVLAWIVRIVQAMCGLAMPEANRCQARACHVGLHFGAIFASAAHAGRSSRIGFQVHQLRVNEPKNPLRRNGR